MLETDRKRILRVVKRVERRQQVDTAALAMALDVAPPRDTERVRVAALDGPMTFIQTMRALVEDE